MPQKTNTSLIVLNLSFKARASSSSDSALSVVVGRGGPQLELRDLRIFKNYQASCINLIYNNNQFVGGIRHRVSEYRVGSIV